MKIYKISYFCFSFKLNEKKSCLKMWFAEGGFKKAFTRGRGLIFNKGVRNISKKGA